MMHGDPEDTAVPKTGTQMLFCPFCRDGFEGRAECPEHDLALVPVDRLPRVNRATHEAAFFADPRLGRGPILLGAALTIVGFFLPFVRTPSLEASALQVAIDGAHNLWLAPGAALAILAVLWIRRDRSSMRSARLAVLGLAIAGSLPIFYTARRIALMADAARTEVDWLVGGIVMATGLVVVGLGALRLGLLLRR
jgi:hypothetical protein